MSSFIEVSGRKP